MSFKPDTGVVGKMREFLSVEDKEVKMILEKANLGGELVGMSQDEWFEQRFRPNVVFLDENGYAKMCVDALKIVPSVAHTDMGASRQRDLAQVWADMTRGYLGELAVVNFLKKIST